jgi:hydroxymethylglutaryl-CoA lyase
MPQFRDAEEVYKQLGHPEGVSFQAPALNMRALDRILALRKDGFGPDTVEVLIATTDAFNKANVGKSTDEQWKISEPIVKAAKDAGLKVTGGIGGCFSCLQDASKVPMSEILKFCERWVDLGVDHIVHAEGTKAGEPSPIEVYDYFTQVLEKYPNMEHRFHLHDAYGWGVCSYMGAMQAGITDFEVGLGGLQGGPSLIIMDRIPIVSSETLPPDDCWDAAAWGLIPTEDFISLLDRMNIETGYDVERLMKIGLWLEHIIGRRLKSKRLRWGWGL